MRHTREGREAAHAALCDAELLRRARGVGHRRVRPPGLGLHLADTVPSPAVHALFALKELNAAEEAKISELVKQAVS